MRGERKAGAMGVSKSAILICVRRKVQASCRLRLKQKGGEDVKKNEGRSVVCMIRRRG